MKQMPQIHKYMTAMPHTITGEVPIRKALELMNAHRIRHFPVLENGKLVGILTDRDVSLASSFRGSDEMTVADVMITPPYAVLPEASLDQVVLEMAERKYGCAVVEQANGKTVGIFTANDGLRVLGEQLGSLYKHGLADAGVRAPS